LGALTQLTEREDDHNMARLVRELRKIRQINIAEQLVVLRESLLDCSITLEDSIYEPKNEPRNPPRLANFVNEKTLLAIKSALCPLINLVK
jgi:hypothetical protein